MQEREDRVSALRLSGFKLSPAKLGLRGSAVAAFARTAMQVNRGVLVDA
jgi:hypothetical protein